MDAHINAIEILEIITPSFNFSPYVVIDLRFSAI